MFTVKVNSLGYLFPSKTGASRLPVISFSSQFDYSLLCYTYRVNKKAEYFSLEARENITALQKLAPGKAPVTSLWNFHSPEAPSAERLYYFQLDLEHPLWVIEVITRGF